MSACRHLYLISDLVHSRIEKIARFSELRKNRHFYKLKQVSTSLSRSSVRGVKYQSTCGCSHRRTPTLLLSVSSAITSLSFPIMQSRTKRLCLSRWSASIHWRSNLLLPFIQRCEIRRRTQIRSRVWYRHFGSYLSRSCYACSCFSR